MNNTVSPKQVQAITREIDEIMASTKVKAENAGSGFFEKMKNLWEDTQAVEFAKVIGKKMEDSVQQLALGGNGLKDGVVDIANFYARRAGKPLMNAPHSSFNGAFNPSVVSDTFDGDTYGFKDSSSAAVLLGEINALTLAYQKLGQETASRISSINAFGNPDIKVKLLSCANKVSQDLELVGKEIEKLAQIRIDKAVKDYNIGDVSQYFGNKGLSVSNEVGPAKLVGDSIYSVKSLANDTSELVEESISNPKLVGEAFVHSLTDNAVTDKIKDIF